MKYVKGDLLEGDWDCAVHCANVHKVMGSGIALYLSRKWPAVAKADNEFDMEENDRLGYFSKAVLPDGRSVFNLYGQIGIGNSGDPLDRNCQYDHLYDALYRACYHLTRLESNIRIGVPYGMGCVRAGGSWLIVDAILADIEERFPVFFIVYDIENGEMDRVQKPQSSVKIPL